MSEIDNELQEAVAVLRSTDAGPIDQVGVDLGGELSPLVQVEGNLGATALQGGMRLADFIGVEEANKWFDEREARQEFLRERALRRWPGRPTQPVVHYRSRPRHITSS